MTAGIVVFSDVPVLLTGLQVKLADDPVLGSAVLIKEAATLVSTVESLQPQALLLDFTAEEVSTSTVRAIRTAAPGCHIVLWARSVSPELAYQAVEMGVRGILQQTLGVDKIRECLHSVLAGELWLDKALTMALLTSKPVTLTRREGQLIGLLSRGLKNKEIATELNIAEGTVKVYLSRLFEKVGAKDRFELALYGVRNLRNAQSWTTATVPAASGTTLRSIVMRPYA